MANVILFVQAHSGVLAGLGVAIIDFVIEIIPSLQQNSLISLVLSFLTPKAAPKA